MRALALSVTCLVLLVVAAPSSASASSFAVGSPEFASALRIGQQQWGGMPCGGHVRFRWTDANPVVNATSHWSGGFTNCRVDFNRNAGMSYAKFCTVMAHELGHLHGRVHVGAPGILMSAVYSGPLPACSAEARAPAQGSATTSTAPAAPVAVRTTTARVPTARACKRKSTRRAVRRCKRKRKRAGRQRRSARSIDAMSAPVLLASPVLAAGHEHG